MQGPRLPCEEKSRLCRAPSSKIAWRGELRHLRYGDTAALTQNCCNYTVFGLAGLPEIEIPAEIQEFLLIPTYVEV